MKELLVTQRFRRDVRRIKRTLKPSPADWQSFEYALELLLDGRKLPPSFSDHALTREYAGYREFHLDADWLIAYKTFPDRVVLHRMGTHRDLFHRWLPR